MALIVVTNHTDTQHRQCTGTFTPSGGKSDRQQGESGLSKPQRSVGGCRGETKEDNSYSIPHTSSAPRKDTREHRDCISSCPMALCLKIIVTKALE